jgi:hypothetical protein
MRSHLFLVPQRFVAWHANGAKPCTFGLNWEWVDSIISLAQTIDGAGKWPWLLSCQYVLELVAAAVAFSF